MNRENKKRFSLLDLFAKSAIITAFMRFTNFIYDSIETSFAGYIFSHSEKTAPVPKGYFAYLSGKLTSCRRFVIALKRLFNRGMEKSVILSRLRAAIKKLLEIPVKTYGVFAFSFGTYTSLTYLVMKYAFGDSGANVLNLYIGIVCVIVTSPMLFSQITLSKAITDSIIMNLILFRFFGLQPHKLRTQKALPGKSYIAFICGMILGVSSSAVSSLYIIAGIFALIAAYAVISSPEIGVVLIFFTLPFLPTMYVAALAVFTYLCYLLKFIQGKRTLKFRVADIAFAAFAVLMLFGGVVSVTPEVSIRPALLYTCFILGYFITVNLIKSLKWAYRCIAAVVASSFIVAVIGVYENFFGMVNMQWLDSTMFSDIEGRVVSTFANPNVLGEYLILTFPFALALLLLSRRVSGKAGALALCGTIGACLIYTWSRGAWLGFLIGVMLFLIIYNRKSLIIMLFGACAIPLLPFVLPANIVNRFLSIGNMSDSSTSYRVNIWRGVIKMIKDYFAGGIGVGEAAFGSVYPRYSLASIETAPHSHNLFLQIIVEIGIFGLFVFVIGLLLFARESFTYFRNSRNDDIRARLFSAAGFCGIIAVLAQGMTDYIWYNYRLSFMFWLITGLTVAVIRSAVFERTEPCLNDTFIDLHYSVTK